MSIKIKKELEKANKNGKFVFKSTNSAQLNL